MAIDLTVARLIAPIIAETSQFAKGLESTTKDAQSWAGKMQKIVSGATKVIAGAALGAAGAIAGIGAAIGKLAIDAAPLEGIGIAFEKMSARVGLSLDDLRTAAAGTVSDFDLMRKANIALTGAGDMLGAAMGKSLPRLLEIARAAAKATGQDVGFLFESLVSGVKRSSPMLIDNTGLVLKMGEANTALAVSLGKTVAELTSEEKQIALLNATAAAGQKMIDEFGGGAATAAEQMAQFKAQIKNAKDQIGIAFLPALQALLMPIQDIAGKAGPKLIEWAQRAGEWLGEKLPLAVENLRSFMMKAWTYIQENVIPIIQSIIAFITDNLEPILAGLVAILLAIVVPAFYAWASAAISAAAATIAALAPVILPLVAVGAVVALLAQAWKTNFLGIRDITDKVVQALKQFWEKRLLPALETVWSFIQNNVIPIFVAVAATAREVVGAAITKLTEIWETVLFPILEMVWGFIQDSVVPLFNELAEIAELVLGLAIRVLAGIWKNVLWPALEKVWKFIKENVIPIFLKLKKKIDEDVRPVLEWLADKILPVIESFFKKIAEAVEWVIAKLKILKEWLKKVADAWGKSGMAGESPSPFETSLRGIADAIADLAEIELPELAASISAMPALAGAGGGAEGGDTYSFSMSVTPATFGTGDVIMGYETMKALAGA